MALLKDKKENIEKFEQDIRNFLLSQSDSALVDILSSLLNDKIKYSKPYIQHY